MSNNHSKVITVENIIWIIGCIVIDIVAILLKPTVYGYLLIGAPLQAGTGVVMSYYFLIKGDLTAFRLKKQAKRFALQVMPIPLVTTGMFIYLSYRHNFPSLSSMTEMSSEGVDTIKSVSKKTSSEKYKQAA